LKAEDFDIIRDEIEIHSSVQSQGICNFHDWIRETDTFYFVLDYAPNGTLFEYLNTNHPLPEPFIKRVLRQVLHTLQALHNQKIIHKDLKPENILLDSNLNVKICDFGWSERLKERNVR
jgi:serine/threonine protein kinase